MGGARKDLLPCVHLIALVGSQQKIFALKGLSLNSRPLENK